jgi:hypothetical protein
MGTCPNCQQPRPRVTDGPGGHLFVLGSECQAWGHPRPAPQAPFPRHPAGTVDRLSELEGKTKQVVTQASS